MFPLFRKGKDTGKPASPPAASSAPAARDDGPITATQAEAVAAATGGIQVHETDLDLPAEAEEAVMLFASGRVGEAATALNRFILENPDSRDPLPWRLLFDLYEATGQRQPYEDLALDFAVRFERSPPAWHGFGKAGNEGHDAREPAFAFGTGLSPQDKARLQHFFQECELADTVVLDFSRTPAPATEEQARTLLAPLSRVAELGKAVRLVGGEAFLVRLNAARIGGRLSESAWLVLLMVLQLMGRADEFEAAAVEFAVRFEISPPSYTPPKSPPSAGTDTRPRGMPGRGHVFPLAGVLGAGSSGLFGELREFAGPLDRVEVDLAQVTRIDFAIVGLLMDTLINLAQGGRKVVLREGSEMVNLLLRMVGAGQYATIQPRTRK